MAVNLKVNQSFFSKRIKKKVVHLKKEKIMSFQQKKTSVKLTSQKQKLGRKLEVEHLEMFFNQKLKNL